MKKSLGSENIFWDLPRFTRTSMTREYTWISKKFPERSVLFSSGYKGKIKKTSGKHFILLVSELEEISQKISRINAFAYLNYATQSGNANAGKFLQMIQEHSSIWQKELIFFDLEWAGLDNRQAEQILRHANIRKYRHYLEKDEEIQTSSLPVSRRDFLPSWHRSV